MLEGYWSTPVQVTTKHDWFLRDREHLLDPGAYPRESVEGLPCLISSSAQTAELLTHPRAQQVLVIELRWKGCYARSLIFMAVLICSINFTASSSGPITNLKSHGQRVELPFSPHPLVSSQNFSAFLLAPLPFSFPPGSLLPHPRGHVHTCSCCILVHPRNTPVLSSHPDNSTHLFKTAGMGIIVKHLN